MAENGYYLYRLGLHSMEALDARDTWASLLNSMKKVLDPNRILAPGRYDGSAVEAPPPSGIT
jgi:hypothetical protein